MGRKRMPFENKLTQPSNKELESIFEGNLNLALFFVTWLKNGQNATKAYKELHPNVSDASARVLASRQLIKVNIFDILAAYELGTGAYFQQLRGGLQAMKWNDFTGEREPDHKVRKGYHDKLGLLLGYEKRESTQALVQNNIELPSWVKEDIPQELREKHGI